MIHAFHLEENGYLSFLGFFRSGAYEIREIRKVWDQIAFLFSPQFLLYQEIC